MPGDHYPSWLRARRPNSGLGYQTLKTADYLYRDLLILFRRSDLGLFVVVFFRIILIGYEMEHKVFIDDILPIFVPWIGEKVGA